MSHLVPLGETGWSLWRDAVLRSTGFAADGPLRFAAPDCAAAADALLTGNGDRALFDKEYEQALADGSAAAREIAADPLLREAVTWQNTTALAGLDGLAAGRSKPSRRRYREEMVARYWQRYCVKNETIGFFGPSSWFRVDPETPQVTLLAGDGLVRDRTVLFEHWALTALAHRLAEDPRLRRWLPPAVQPHLTLDGRRLLRPAQPPLPVNPQEAAALAACDGRRSAVDVAAALVSAGTVRTEADALLLLERLADRGVLAWSGDLPQGPQAERRLRELLAGVAPAEVREPAVAALDRLAAARDQVADAAGDPEALAAAFTGLGEVFTELTGAEPTRRGGQTYAGRALCFEDATRDVQLVLGGRLLDELAEPLALLLGAARWLTAELAAAYGTALRDLADELQGGEPVRLADVWYLAQGLLFGGGRRPVDAVSAEFVSRWAALFGLDGAPAGTHELRFTAAELAGAAARAFPAERPGWSAGRLHSPDLQICAESVDAINRGDYLAVLSELHAAWPTFDCAVFTQRHPDPASLRAALTADLGERRVRPLYPTDWPRHTARVSHSLDAPDDPQLGFAPAPGADPDRLLPATSVIVSAGPDGEPVATAPDGRSWPLLEMFSALLAMHAVDGFKLVAAAPHSPRITVGKLVVAREAWRTTVAGTGLAGVTGDRNRYLAVREWRQRLGLPEQVFVKLGSETKPVYVDLTSPVYAWSLCTMLRGAPDGGAAVTVTELLPGADQTWLTDAAGRRYHCELRLHAVDPESAP